MSKKAGIKMCFADLAAQWLASIEQGIKESTWHIITIHCNATFYPYSANLK